MRPQGVHHHARAEFRQIVRADHCAFVLRNDVVDPRLVLDQVADAWQVGQRPFHVTQETCLRVSSRRPGLEHLFECRQPGVQLEASSAERAVLPRPDLQLAGGRHLWDVDARFGEPPEMFVPQLGINVVVSLVALIETILDERAKHTVLLVDAVEERANMAILTEGIPGGVRGVSGGIQILTFTQTAAFWPGGPVRRAPEPYPQAVEAQPGFDERDPAYARPLLMSTGGRSC